jgi:hypothetical protein
MYLVAIMFVNTECDDAIIPTKIRGLFMFGVHFNMPLILIYPLALSFFPWISLGFINACLHFNLTIAWGLQWFTLRQMCNLYYPKQDPDWLKMQASIFHHRHLHKTDEDRKQE